MIITRTPLRISFVGGGTDFRDFYKNEVGCVVSMAINKYVYVVVNKRFENDIRVSYSKTEIVDDINFIEHGIVRECLRKLNIREGIEINIISDVPGKGTGLGSSSSLTVGLLYALHLFKNEEPTKRELAEEACEIEIDILLEPIGKQDQYAAALGGLNAFTFEEKHVSVCPIKLSALKKKKMLSKLGIFHTGLTRNSREILWEQRVNIPSRNDSLSVLSAEAEMLYLKLCLGELTYLQTALNHAWDLKKTLSSSITNEFIDGIYDMAMSNGATAGKLLGAGGGGFILFYSDNISIVKDALSRYKMLENLDMDLEGTKCIYNM